MSGPGTDARGPIAGLGRYYAGLHFQANVAVFEEASGDLGESGPNYQCWGGVPHILFPSLACPDEGPDEMTASATLTSSSSFNGLTVADLDPTPDFAIVWATFGFRIWPWAQGCARGGGPGQSADPGDPKAFGCDTPAKGYEEMRVNVTSSIPTMLGVNYRPWDGWTSIAWEPGQDPDYFTTFDYFAAVGPQWAQFGSPLLVPNDIFYVDPDPDDPNIVLCDYLFPWADVVNLNVMVDIVGTTKHRIDGFMNFSVVPFFILDDEPDEPPVGRINAGTVAGGVLHSKRTIGSDVGGVSSL